MYIIIIIIIWPRGKAGRQKNLGWVPLRLSFLYKGYGLWALSCDFVLRS